MRRPRLRLFRERSGNVALIFALLTPVLVLFAGGAVDMVNVSMHASQLQEATDAAAIAAVARSSAGYQYALNMASNGQVPGSVVNAGALAVFNADRRASSDTTVNSFTVDEEKVGQTVTVNVTAQATFGTSFLGMMGMPTIPLTLTSHASDNIPTYMNFYLLLDNTPSMGLGATPPDIANLQAATPGSCAFSCHATGDPGDDNYTISQTYAAAHGITITMRIDVVRQATQQLTQTAYSTEQADGISNEFNMAIYDAGPRAYLTPVLYPVSGLTSNITTQTYNDASSIGLMSVPDNNYAYTDLIDNQETPNNDEDTDFDFMFSALSTIMVPTGVSGNGSSATAPQQVLFFVTDGMVDMNNSGSRYIGGINPATCNAVKAKGIKIAILYTTYLPSSISNDSWSQSNVLPIIQPTDTVAAALQACASPGLYYPVSPSQGIPQAMAALFQIVVATTRITG